jgi:hypothetical protein
MSNVNANTNANANANAKANAKAILQVYNKAYKESLEAQRGVIAKYIEGAKTNANFKKYKTTQNLQTAKMDKWNNLSDAEKMQIMMQNTYGYMEAKNKVTIQKAKEIAHQQRQQTISEKHAAMLQNAAKRRAERFAKEAAAQTKTD